MRRLFWIVLFLVLSNQANVYCQETLFAQGNTKYREGKFSEATKLYESIVQDPKAATAAAYYNLGNSSLKSGARAHALVYYQRALKAAPRDKDLRWNLHVLKGVFADNIEDKSDFVTAFLREYFSYLRMDEVAYLFSFSLILLALYFVFQFLSSGASYVWIRQSIIALIFLSAVLFGLKFWVTKDPHVVILDKEVYAYYGPSDQETKAFLLHEGAEGAVIDESGDWYDIILANKNTGWIRKSSCEIV